MRRFDSSTTKYAPAHEGRAERERGLAPVAEARRRSPMTTPIEHPKNSAMTPDTRPAAGAAEPAEVEAEHQAELHVTEAHPARRDQMEDEEDAEDRGRADERPGIASGMSCWNDTSTTTGTAIASEGNTRRSGIR